LSQKTSGWIMKQTWEDLLFLHWSVDCSWLQSMLPPQLEVDTFDGKAWVGIVPFEMTHIRFRGLPPVPFASRLFELNVRTYVKYGEKRGVYFFSLAREFFHLPYFRAKMGKKSDGNQISFWSSRNHKNVNKAQYHIIYEPVGEAYETTEGNLDYWLTERDRLLIVRGHDVYQGKIKHTKWPLQKVDVAVLRDTLSQSYHYHEPSITHFSKSVTTYLWPFEKITKTPSSPIA
jgi:uncharacterized protein YqjF (DUF2071 family)